MELTADRVLDGNKPVNIFRRFLVTTKIYLNRALSYWGIVNYCIMMWLLLSSLEAKGWIELTPLTIAIIYPCLIILIYVIGFIDEKLKIMHGELEYTNDRTSQISEIRLQTKK